LRHGKEMAAIEMDGEGNDFLNICPAKARWRLIHSKKIQKISSRLFRTG
jgi:hypothetical protein